MKSIISIICLICLTVFSFGTSAKAATTIDAKIVRNQAGTGSCLISSGFPVPPGLVTEQIIHDGKVKVIVGGNEVSANVSALRGRHVDGTLRSMLIQLNSTMTQGEEIAASVIVDGGVRAYPDPQYKRPTLAIVSNNNVIVPTDKKYLVTTGITLRGLLPEGSGSATEESFYTIMANDRFDWLAAGTNVAGMASYEHVSAIISFWARSGNIKYQKEAIKQVLEWLPYNTPAASQIPPCRNDVVTNPDGRTGGQACGLPAEWHAPRMLGYAQAYLLTGYRDFWGIVASLAQYNQWDVTDQSSAYSKIIKYQEFDNPRLNYATRYGALLAALMIDATIPVNGQYSTGRTFNWENQIKWTIDTLEHYAWDFKWVPFNNGSGNVPNAGSIISQGGVTATLLGVYEFKHDEQNYPTSLSRPATSTIPASSVPASGYLMVNNISGGSFTAGSISGIAVTATDAEQTDYRQGLVAGVRSNSPRGLTRADNYADGPAKIPIFQLIFPANFLIDTYLYFYRDSRIPDMIQKQVDVILQNIRPKAPGDPYYSVSGGGWGDHKYVKPYPLEDPPALAPVGFPNATIPFELPEYARMLAFVIKTKGEATVNGFSYSQWYDKLIDTANAAPLLMTWQWKYFGQFYSWGIDAPWMKAQSSLTNYGPSTMRVPTQYAVIPGDVPDVYYIGGPSAPVNLKQIPK